MRDAWPVVLSAALIACATHYTVDVTPRFNTQAQMAFTRAVADWESKVPVKLDLYFAECPTVQPLDTICARVTDSIPPLPWEPGQLTGFTLANNIWLAVPKLSADDDAHQQRIIEHELGHAMGLQHDVEGTLMYPYSNGGALTVTPRDVEQWKRIRGLQ